MSDQSNSFDEWAIVEVMGHCRFAGRVSEQTIGGGSFLRIDIPQILDKPAYTKIFGHGSIYCITPCSEDVAIKAEESFYNLPVNVVGIHPNAEVPAVESSPEFIDSPHDPLNA